MTANAHFAMKTPDEPLPREDITATFRGGSQSGLEITVDLHRDHEFTHKPTGERYRRCAEAPTGNLRFYFDLQPNDKFRDTAGS